MTFGSVYQKVYAIMRWIAMAYLLALSILIGHLMADVFVIPQVPISITILNPGKTITPSEPIKYRAQFYRTKNCKADVLRFVVRDIGDDEEIGYRDQIIGILTQGHDRLVKTISVMEHPPLEPGEYALRLYVASKCSLIERIDQYPDEMFSVVEKR